MHAAEPPPAPLRFLVNGDPVTVSGLPPQTTLLEYLREHRGLCGTKEGCAEGDCGACTVALAESDGTRVTWSPVNACIRLLPSVAGKAVMTVESLQSADGSLHPVQQALVEHHGSQCGFCTPGFAMSLYGLYKNASRPSTEQIEDALSGNLCRCTGYRPIVAAAHAMYDMAPAPADNDAKLRASLASIASADPLEYASHGRRWWSPRSVDALAALLLEHPHARIVAGATDVGLWVTKQHRDVGDIVHTGDVAELRAIRRTASHLHIGAAATLTEAFAALDASWPELREAWARFASVPIRNSGTLGGNVANGSPIGDSMPALIALGATVLLRRGNASREIDVADLYVGYQKTAMAPGEFVQEIRVPARDGNLLLCAYKVSKRYDQDISAVFACFALRVERGVVASARIGCGGVAAVPRRAVATERVLAGQPWNEVTADAAAAEIEREFSPIDDMRASAAYRRAALGNLVRRFHLETSGALVRTRVEQATT